MSDDVEAVEAGTITEPSLPVALQQNKRPTIIIYPTVSPESVVVPIVSCIIGFPILALLVICCLRRRAKLARERERRRAGKLDDHGALNLVRFSPIHRLGMFPGSGRTKALSLSSERAMSRGFPSLELDTVVEEKSDPDPEDAPDVLNVLESRRRRPHFGRQVPAVDDADEDAPARQVKPKQLTQQPYGNSPIKGHEPADTEDRRIWDDTLLSST